MQNLAIRVYVGTYKKYNNGSIDGGWLSLNDFIDYDDFIEACKKLHKDEHDPEFMFQDSEVDYDALKSLISESYINSDIYDIIDAIENSDDIDMVFSYIDAMGCDLNNDGIHDIIQNAENAYQGFYSSDEEFARNFVNEMGYLENPITLLYDNIDWKGVAHDLMHDYVGCDGYYFSNH